MTNHDEKRSPKKPGKRILRQARITTKTKEEMLEILKDQPFEFIGRGPRQMSDGSYVAEIIGEKKDLDKVQKLKFEISIKSAQRIKDSDKQISKTNRYIKKNVIPRGVGIKE